MTATNHAGFGLYIYTHAKGQTLVAVRPTHDEAVDLIKTMPTGEYSVREAVWLNGVVV